MRLFILNLGFYERGLYVQEVVYPFNQYLTMGQDILEEQ